MNSIHYIGLDVHKKVIAYCVKTQSGRIRDEGMIAATRPALDEWLASLKRPWIGAMEATLFTGWIYDHLRPHARELKVAHPLMLRAIAASKKKNDRIDAQKIADLLRADLLPECYMAPESIRQLRRQLRYRNLMVRQAVKMKNKTVGLLMEIGESYEKKKLHGDKYFNGLLARLEHTPDSVKEMMSISHDFVRMFDGIQRKILTGLRRDPQLKGRVGMLMTINGVGEVLALTWALEIGDVGRFATIRQAISYCGLCSGQNSSAGKDKRTPISKQRNKHLQCMLIEAAKLAPQWNPALAQVREREQGRGNRNRATLAVARKMVAYLMAVDKKLMKYELRMNGD